MPSGSTWCSTSGGMACASPGRTTTSRCGSAGRGPARQPAGVDPQPGPHPAGDPVGATQAVRHRRLVPRRRGAHHDEIAGQLGAVAPTAGQLSPHVGSAEGLVGHPRRRPQGRAVTDVAAMVAVEERHPVADVVLLEPDDPPASSVGVDRDGHGGGVVTPSTTAWSSSNSAGGTPWSPGARSETPPGPARPAGCSRPRRVSAVAAVRRAPDPDPDASARPMIPVPLPKVQKSSKPLCPVASSSTSHDGPGAAAKAGRVTVSAGTTPSTPRP